MRLVSTGARSDLSLPPQVCRQEQRHKPTLAPGHTRGVRHPHLTTSPPHCSSHEEVPWHIPQPSSSLESGQSGWPSQSQVSRIQVLSSRQRNSPAGQGWRPQLRRVLSMPSGQSSMLSQEQRLPLGGEHCPSWVHSSVSGVQSQSGP